MLKKIKFQNLNQHIFKQGLYYFLFSLVFFIFHSLLITLVAYFHFLLGHRLSIIEDWIFKNSWEIMSLAKIFSLIFTLKLLVVGRNQSLHWRRIFLNALGRPHRNLFSFLIFMVLILIFMGEPTLRARDLAEIHYREILVSYLGVTLFYLADIFLLLSMKIFFPLSKKGDYYLFYLLFPLAFYTMNKFILRSEIEGGIFCYLHILTCSLLMNLKNGGALYPVLYVGFFAAPLSSLLGLDPIWKDTYSLLEFKKSFDVSALLAIWFVAAIFLLMTDKVPLQKEKSS